MLVRPEVRSAKAADTALQNVAANLTHIARLHLGERRYYAAFRSGS
jgi:hypothetical protein